MKMIVHKFYIFEPFCPVVADWINRPFFIDCDSCQGFFRASFEGEMGEDKKLSPCPCELLRAPTATIKWRIEKYNDQIRRGRTIRTGFQIDHDGRPKSVRAKRAEEGAL